MDVDGYLDRIGLDVTPAIDLESLRRLQRAHLASVPFENLSIVRGEHITTDAATSIDKIVRRRRGGWCFELNGAFAELLRAVGFEVRLLGAAVLLGGPSTIVDHLTLEVGVDEPYLVDVGFGDSFIEPLALNRSGPQDGGNATYELIASPQGTTLTRHRDGIPVPEYRFKRVALTLDAFTPISDSMQADRTKRWRSHPFATRLLDGGPDRVTLTEKKLKVVRAGDVAETSVAGDDWDTTLASWFGRSMLD